MPAQSFIRRGHEMKRINRCGCLSRVIIRTVLIICAAIAVRAAPSKNIDLTVLSGPMQKFGGFGMHQGKIRFNEQYADTISKLVIRDLKITHGRIYPISWDGMTTAEPDLLVKSIDDYNADFVFATSGTCLFDYWKQQSPGMFWICSYWLSRITGPVMRDSAAMKMHCDTIALIIKAFAEQLEMHFSWVGIVNEPNETKEGILDTVKAADGSDSVYVLRRVPTHLYPQLVKIMRASLDAQGLDTLKIMGPEVSNVDNTCYEYLEAVKQDAEAYKAFEVLFSKAYNMCASPYMKAFALEKGIPYLAAAGANTIEGPTSNSRQFPYENTTDNTHYAADAAARILNDFNHGVTHWAWYFNVQEFYHVEPSHRLIWPFSDSADAAKRIADPWNGFALGPDLFLVVSLKYYYIKQLAQAIDAGGHFRDCRAGANRPQGMTDDMFYTYGRKPAINASAILNPDSTFTIAVVNMTGATSDTAAQPRFIYYDSVSYTVNIAVEEMTDIPEVKFGVVRSNTTKRLNVEDSVAMLNGALSIAIEPLELVTLRSDKVDLSTGVVVPRSNTFALGNTCIVAGRHALIRVHTPGEYIVCVTSARGAQALKPHTRMCTSPGTVRLELGKLCPGIYFVHIAHGRQQKAFKLFYLPGAR
jgi:hypothetical protein